MAADSLAKLASVDKLLDDMQECVDEAEREAQEVDELLSAALEQAERSLEEMAECRRKMAAWSGQSL
jgi:DNA repair ATPase RecN